MSIGENVRRLRKDRDMTQDSLAAAIDVHQTHISSIERGATPSIEVIQQLAVFFGVSLDELVNGEPSILEIA